MRLRGRRNVRSVVALQPGNPPTVLLGYGFFTIEATIPEALEHANAITDAVEQAKRRGGGGCS
jgi:hypothetical protein